MLRGPKHSEIGVVVPKEEEESRWGIKLNSYLHLNPS
jgi:hypothetical protein